MTRRTSTDGSGGCAKATPPNFKAMAVQTAIANENPNKQIQVGVKESRERTRSTPRCRQGEPAMELLGRAVQRRVRVFRAGSPDAFRIALERFRDHQFRRLHHLGGTHQDVGTSLASSTACRWYGFSAGWWAPATPVRMWWAISARSLVRAQATRLGSITRCTFA